MPAKKANELMKMSQFELLDCYRNGTPLVTPFGAHKIEKLVRISQYEYQLTLRPLFQEEHVLYYLKLNNYDSSAFLNILYRWEPNNVHDDELQDEEGTEGGCRGV